MKKHRLLAWVLAGLSAALLLLGLYCIRRAGPGGVTESAAPPIPAPPASSAPAPEPTRCGPACPVPEGAPPVEEPPPAEADDGLPLDKLFITAARRDYRDGGLQLIIPKLGVDVPVLDGVDPDTLLRGEGLYDYAQLPSETRSNTSIAGHRNWVRNGKITLDQPFSHLDELGEGDYLYLRDGAHIYQYLWESTEVVEADDWGPIYKRAYSCVTLTTCTPVGVSDHRLIVRGALTDAIPISEDYGYPAAKEAEAP